MLSTNAYVLPDFRADFLPETAAIRADPTWQGPPPAPGLVDRRVEITGPVDRKMVINALNSGATQFMADFEGKHQYSTAVRSATAQPTTQHPAVQLHNHPSAQL